MKQINEIAHKLNLENNIENYGKYKAKINLKGSKKNAKLILVTSVSPTKYGEGKTTITIGINDAMWKIGKKSVAVLREPSLGPVFGIKGGATGGGKSSLANPDDINLHFTGDLHAITSANNLICAMIDNHIFQGNKLNIDPESIIFNRCLDMNDRSLREVKLSNRTEKFNITAASEIMAIFTLAKDLDDLKVKIDNILIGYTFDNNPVYAKELNCTNACVTLLREAFKPNLVQTIEEAPVIIHGGPFANIAHGCNSLVATNLGLEVSDYVITEAGFGSDLGAEKFFDIKCRNDLHVDLTVLNVTVQAMKYHGEDNLEVGISNLQAHIDNMKLFNDKILVVLNKHDIDTEKEINYIKNYVEDQGIEFSISEAYLKGSLGAIDLAEKIVKLTNDKSNNKFVYELTDSIEDKINKVCTKIYHSNPVNFKKDIQEKIDKLKELGYSNLPICIAKTPSSISHNPKILGYPKNYDIEFKDIRVSAGAGFIVVYLGNIMTMPGLPKVPNATKF